MLPRYFIVKRPMSSFGSVLRYFLASSLRRCWILYLAAFLLFVGGFVWGLKSASLIEKNEAVHLEDYLSRLVAPDANQDRGAVFRHAAARNIVPVGAMYVAGLTVIGMPVVAGVLFLRGYALGFTTGFLVFRKGLYGFGLVLAEIFPQNVLLMAALLFSAVASVSFSLLLLRRGFNPEIPVFPSFLRYTGMMAVMGIVTLGAALVEAYIVPGITQIVLPVLEK